jgi:LmbE family N-acetylglucosaminyl deacetylase
MPLRLKGKVSWFGGPNDMGVSPSEGLAFIYEVEMAPHLFLPTQPPGTTGLARRLNPYVHFIACRWDYDIYPKDQIIKELAVIRAVKTQVVLTAFPADWGPHSDTNRVADISEGLMFDLGITTDDEVEVALMSELRPAVIKGPLV